MTLRIVMLPEASKIVHEIEWPSGVPPPFCDALVDEEGGADLRFTDSVDAEPETYGERRPMGDSPIETLGALATLCRAWCARFGVHPGVYPNNPMARLVGAITLRQAATWATHVRLSAGVAGMVDSLRSK